MGNNIRNYSGSYNTQNPTHLMLQDLGLRVKARNPIPYLKVVISGVISRVTILITRIKGLLTPLITTHEQSSKPYFPPGGSMLPWR